MDGVAATSAAAMTEATIVWKRVTRVHDAGTP
jgi:hypothetical protein